MRKTWVAVALFTVVANALAGVTVDINTLQWRDGQYYLKNSGEDVLFSGKAVRYYDNGQVALESSFSQGLKHGMELAWYEDGKPKHKVRYRHGEAQGLGSSWYPRHEPPRKETFFDCGDALDNSSEAFRKLCGDAPVEEPSHFESCRSQRC